MSKQTYKVHSEIKALLLFLLSAFPTVFSSPLVQHELVANYSHLFWVRGSQPDLAPYLLLAHIDVVPAALSDGWDAPPFSAEEIDGFIYGRGTIDDKSSLMVGQQTDKRPPTCSFRCGSATNLLCVFAGNASGLGVLADKRLRSTTRILHQPRSRRRSISLYFCLCNLASCVTS